MPLLSVLTGYLLGSLPWGLWIGRLRGVDVRLRGSGNVGATNVGRVLGKRTGFLVLSLDIAKGVLAVLLGRAAAAANPEALAFLPALCGTAAIVGHIAPPWTGFRGGKGVATGAGVAAVLTPLPFVVSLAVFGLVLLASRRVSLGSILSAAALPVAVLLLSTQGPERPWLLGWSLLAAGLVTARHAGNVRRLMRGEEPRLGESKPEATGREKAVP
jgi:glycerol-3-phosphate acyltransferase PlsY